MELLDSLIELSDLGLGILLYLLQLGVEVGALLGKYGALTLVGGGDTCESALDLLVGLALLVVLSLGGLLLLRDACDLILGVPDEILALVSQSLFIPLNSLLHLLA